MRARLLNLFLVAAIGLAASGCSPDLAGGFQRVTRAIMSTPVAADEPALGVTAPAGSVEATIQDVILRSNQQQMQAIASRDPAIMRETSTDAHFRDMADSNQAMIDAGISAIRLVNLEWGDISVSGARATATTWETWVTSFPRGGTDESRERNVYLLIQQDGLWKIQSNEHPDAFASPPGSEGQGSGSGIPSRVEAPAPAPVDPNLPSAVTRGQSSNWSGYAAVGGPFTGVTGTWTVPEPTADGNMGITATWVGIGGERTRDLIQAGTEETVLSSGRIRYRAWYEMLPAPSRPVPLTVRAGDSVTVSVNQEEPGIWGIAFVNHTTGGTYDRTVSYDSSLSSAEWIVEAPSMLRGGLLPLGNFGAIHFAEGSAIKNGETMSLAQANARPITMINRRNEALATPSILDRSGSGFTVRREDASPTVGSSSRRRGGQ